jgi:hypothetical protein
MQADPMEEWRRLTELYREMYDGELIALAAEPEDLTETARRVLSDEMKKRGLDDPRAPKKPPPTPDRAQASKWAFGAEETDPEDAGGDGEPAHEYTWKTELCEVNSREEAWQVWEVLRRAGIESWVRGPGSRFGWNLFKPQVLVAADRLEEAQEVAARPIPQDVIDESKVDIPEYELPRCPRCGAEDPLLESVEPVNEWSCESCGNQWSEAVGAADGDEEKAGRQAP